MKKVLLFSAALFVIALGMGVSASAETKKIGNFKYEYDLSLIHISEPTRH